jgi:tellurite resistance protein TerC
MEFVGIPIWIWGAFLAFLIAMLALDLGVFHKNAHEVSMKEALTWSAVWIALALGFNLILWLNWESIQPNSPYTPNDAGLAFFTGYLIEKALSVDNIFVFLMVFSYFGIPRKYQHSVLFWGIIGALIFRAIFIAAGAALLHNFAWVIVIFGGFLIITGIKMLVVKEKEMDPDKNPLIKFFRKVIPVTPELHGQHFFVKIDGKRWATPLFICLLFIEFSDIIFAVDSVPAILAITKDPFIVFTSNVFAILGLRALFFAVDGLVVLFRFLKVGLSFILIFIGGKMLWTFIQDVRGVENYKFPVAISLGIICLILVGSIVASLIFKAKPEQDEA